MSPSGAAAAAPCTWPGRWPPEHVGLAAQAGSELGEAAEVGLCGRTATAAAGLVGVLE